MIEIDRCLLLDERLNDYLPEVRTESPGLRGFDLFLDDKGGVHPFYIHSKYDQGADFIQVNPEVNRKMLEYIQATVRSRLTEIRKDGAARLLDLFCGDGNLSLPFADTAASITGWDYSRTAVERAEAGAESAMEKNPDCRIKYHEADLSRSWKKIAAHAGRTDCILVDPPRKGLKKQAAQLAGLRAPIIIYVSCSPPALVRDLAVMKDYGYQLKELQPLDMFPQTYHLETVAVLARN